MDFDRDMEIARKCKKLAQIILDETFNLKLSEDDSLFAIELATEILKKRKKLHCSDPK
jgi:hypothetical protein